MPGPTITTHDSLVDIFNVKIGRTDAYAAGGASDAGLEQKILKAVLGEGDTATSIDDFKTLASALAVDSATHKTATISGDDLQVTQHFRHRNAVVLADYLQNEDNTENASSSGAVLIRSGVNQSAPSKILADSSAFENATVKFTVTDPYAEAGASGNFYSTNNVFTGHFADPDSTHYRNTRNVNANCANTAGTPSISVTEHTAWNTADYGVEGAGPAFVNGIVSLNGEGAPLATLHTADVSVNILSTVYVGTSGLGFDISYDSSRGEPEVGKYALNFVSTDGGAATVTITSNNMSSDLVVVGDKTQYEAFLIDTTTQVVLTDLPEPGSLAVNTLDPYLSEENTTQLPGFKFEIESETAVTGQVLITTTDGFTSPFQIDAEQMDFDLKNKYYLEQSVDEDESTLMLATTVAGVSVTNSLTITNGSLALTGTDAALFELLDGNESLGQSEYNTDGSIVIFDSSSRSAYNTNESAKPRAVGGSANFASDCVVNYSVDEAFYIEEVGVLAEADKTVDNLAYELTTLVSQTSAEGPEWDNKIDHLNGAVALVSQTNASITPSAITFLSNSNTNYNNDEVQVIDLVCQQRWQEGNAYKTDNTEIAGVAVNIIGSNVTDAAGLKDLRVKLDAKTLSELSFPALLSNDGWAIAVNDGSDFLKTSVLKQGVLDDSDIIDILTVVDPDLTLTVEFGPAINSVNANKYTKFHNQLTITYKQAEQITYNDEFTISNYSVNSETIVDVTAQHLYVPANTKLTQRSFTETFKVSTPFRFGNYSNISITTPTITQTTTYYALTDNINADKILPRSYLAPIRTIAGNLVPQAMITDDMTTVTVAFNKEDLQPFKSQLQQQVGGSDDWVNVTSGGDAHVDLWYNTNTYLESSVGDFEYAFSFSPAVNSMAEQTFYIDMSLEKGAAAFSITGKKFTPAQVDALGEFDIATFDLATATGTAITGMTASYTPDESTPGVSGSTTLSGGGYTFTYSNNIYVNIRIVVCPNGMFKVVRNAGTATYKSMSSFGEMPPYVKLGEGIYVAGGLENANHGDNTTWTLPGDAIQVNFWLGQGVTDFTRITALNNDYRYDEDWKGVKNLIVRGFTPDSSVTIERTPSTFVFDIAGYRYSGDLHSNISYQNSAIGDLYFNAVAGAVTMYPASFGAEPKVFPLSINYGSYTIRDTSGDGATPIVTSVSAYKTVISNRKGVRIISRSLSTTVSSYSIFYTTSNTLTVHRIGDYTSTESALINFDQIDSINLADLQNGSVHNYIGNVLDIHYYGESALPNLTCFFTIAPAFLKFQAVDHTNLSIVSIPFVKDDTQLVTRYSAVDHSDSNPQSWTPFASSVVNNMTISAAARSYENYRGDDDATVVKFNVNPNNLKIEYATEFGADIGTYSTVYDGAIPVDVLDSDDVNFVSNFAITGKLAISLNQSVISSSAMPVIFDNSDKFNLLVELGSHLLTPKEIILDFNAGDCTGLTTYCIDEMNQIDGNLEVTIAKYTNGSGLNSNLFNRNVSNGIAVTGSTKETITFSTPMTNNMENMLENIKAVIPSSITGWVDNYDVPDNVLWLKPTSDTGKTALRTALLLNTNVPRSITVFELDDAIRVMDNQGIALYRIASQGIQYRNSLGDYENDNLGTLVHAHLIR